MAMVRRLAPWIPHGRYEQMRLELVVKSISNRSREKMPFINLVRARNVKGIAISSSLYFLFFS
jgi:hypothetical protein